MRDMKISYKILGENLKGRDHLGETHVDRIILRWNLRRQGVRMGLDSSGSGYGPMVQQRTVVNTVINFQVPIKGKKFLDHVSNYKFQNN
jgi:hypothetical protein